MRRPLDIQSCAFVQKSLEEREEFGIFTGYGSTYNLDLVGDKVMPGAFAKSITERKGKVPIFLNHSSDTWAGHTVSLAEDHKGLQVEAQIFTKTNAGRDVWELLKATNAMDVRVGLSIGFVPTVMDWENDVRLLKEVDLWEVSLTPFPAQPKAFVEEIKTVRDLERHLRDVECFSKSDSRRICTVVAAFYKSSGGMLDDPNARLLDAVKAALTPAA